MELRLFLIATVIYYVTYMVKALIWIPLFGGGFAAHDVSTLLGWTALSATAIYLITVGVTAFVWTYGTFDPGYRGGAPDRSLAYTLLERLARKPAAINPSERKAGREVYAVGEPIETWPAGGEP